MRALDTAQANRQMADGDAAPWELVEAQVFEKFGWTPAQLDKMDSDRVLRAVQALGIRDVASHDWQKKQQARSAAKKR